tara:strand:- start:773 stop:1495 length:723 start_codon:yes stop_codon:yes gene_type:complete
MKILIATCKKYYPVAAKTCKSISEHLKNFEIVLISDEGTPMLDYVENIRHKKDIGWNAMIKKYLENNDMEKVIIWMDDLIIKSKIDDYALDYAIKVVLKNDLDYLSLYQPPARKLVDAIQSDFKPKNTLINDRYPISTMCSIFSRNMLLELLREDESPWEFEKNAKSRIGLQFKISQLGFNIVDIKNVISKGKIVKWRFNEKIDGFKHQSSLESLLYKLQMSYNFFKQLSIKDFFNFLFK